jgi:archaellum biogenesis ATPase FlaH
MSSNAFETLTLAQLLENSKDQPIEYLVDGLLPVGSLNMIAGKPKSGKSTLVRQLASCIAKGTDFLGRSTTKGEVLYFASEELGAHLVEHFQLLDINDGIHVVLRRPGVGFVSRLAATLKQLPDVKLVIIDPLVNFLPNVDMDNYGQTAPALADLVETAEKRGVVILAIHHLKKRATEEAGDAILGSSAIVAAMCTSIFLTGEMGDMRKIRTSQRYGSRLDYTELEFDESKRVFSIGHSVKSQQEKRVTSTKETYLSNIVAHISDNPGIDQRTLLGLVGGNTKGILTAVNDLIEQGKIRREGKGEKGSPYAYHGVPDPDENWGSGVVCISAAAA